MTVQGKVARRPQGGAQACGRSAFARIFGFFLVEILMMTSLRAHHRPHAGRLIMMRHKTHLFLVSKSELNRRKRCVSFSSSVTEVKFSNRKDSASPSSKPASLANCLRRRYPSSVMETGKRRVILNRFGMVTLRHFAISWRCKRKGPRRGRGLMFRVGRSLERLGRQSHHRIGTGFDAFQKRAGHRQLAGHVIARGGEFVLVELRVTRAVFQSRQ